MASLLALDIGSSSVIAGLLRGKRVVTEAPRVFFRSRCEGAKVEVDPCDLLRAIETAVRGLGKAPLNVDAVTLAVMSPAWIVMDRTGKALTPFVTHQDRRSVDEAIRFEHLVGTARHLAITGNRPFPGGISSTTWLWYRRYAPAQLKNADLVGHLNTFLHRQFTGERVIDPSNASFTGLYETIKLGGWSKELCEAAHVPLRILPEIREADECAGRLNPTAAALFNTTVGTPMLTGLMDGSAGMLLAGANEGQLFNVCGSTDVLALCVSKPKPHPKLLTRALGVGKKWLSVGTLAAVASSIYWVREHLFREVPIDDFRQLVHRLSRQGPSAAGGVTFEPFMAGERTNIEQRSGSFTGITLATTRDQILSAVIEGLVKASAERLPLLERLGTPIQREVAVSGGADRLDKIFHRDWPGDWHYRSVRDATLRGLARLEPRQA